MFSSELAQDLKYKTYHPSLVLRVMIPKADGSLRSLGIPTIRDRLAQMAVKLYIEIPKQEYFKRTNTLY